MSTVTTPPQAMPNLPPQKIQRRCFLKKLARSRPLVRSRDRQARHQGLIPEAEPGHAGEEPGDVRGGSGRGCSTTVFVVRDIFAGAAGAEVRACRSRSGSGSRCCSRISPKPWRKRAARRRPTACARPRPTRWPSASPPSGKIEAGTSLGACARATWSSPATRAS